VVGKILKIGMLARGCASVANARVSGVGKALNWQALVVCREWREFSIVIIVVALVDRGYEVPFAAAGFGERFALGEAAIEAVGSGSGGEGAAASVGKGESASGELGGIGAG
jgi:hypothetical protein